MPSKKWNRFKKSVRSQTSTLWKKYTRATKQMGSHSVALAAAICLMTASLLIGYQVTHSEDTASIDTGSVRTAAQARASKQAIDSASARELMQAPAPTPTLVTITGCLERGDSTFRLKDTTGADAPKSRSWKSGFLKSGSASIQVVDAGDRLNLSNHVGQRVSLTGTLVDREMKARSLQSISASCSGGPKIRT